MVILILSLNILNILRDQDGLNKKKERKKRVALRRWLPLEPPGPHSSRAIRWIPGVLVIKVSSLDLPSTFLMVIRASQLIQIFTRSKYALHTCWVFEPNSILRYSLESSYNDRHPTAILGCHLTNERHPSAIFLSADRPPRNKKKERCLQELHEKSTLGWQDGSS